MRTETKNRLDGALVETVTNHRILWLCEVYHSNVSFFVRSKTRNVYKIIFLLMMIISIGGHKNVIIVSNGIVQKMRIELITYLYVYE